MLHARLSRRQAARPLHTRRAGRAVPWPAPADAQMPHLARLDLANLLADGNHGVAEAVQLSLGLALGGLDHEGACKGQQVGRVGGGQQRSGQGGEEAAHSRHVGRQQWGELQAAARGIFGSPETGHDMVGAWKPKSMRRLAMSSASIPVASVMGLRGRAGRMVSGRGRKSLWGRGSSHLAISTEPRTISALRKQW